MTDIRKNTKGLRGRVSAGPAATVGGMTVVSVNGKRMLKANSKRKVYSASSASTGQDYFMQGSASKQFPMQTCNRTPDPAKREEAGAFLDVTSLPIIRYGSSTCLNHGKHVASASQYALAGSPGVYYVDVGSYVSARKVKAAQNPYVVISEAPSRKGHRTVSPAAEPSGEEMHREMNDFAQQLRNDPRLAQDFFYNAGLVTETGEWKEHYRNER